MESKVFDGPQQDIPAVLANRDRRAKVQANLLQENPHQVVVTCKLNIPGPVKNSKAIRSFFERGTQRLEDQWMKTGQSFELQTSWLESSTGPESFYLLYGNGTDVKRGTVSFEEATPFNRLFDLDVLINDHGEPHSLSRGEFNLPVRTCLICGRPAKECGRSRSHSVEELQAQVADLIEQGHQQAGRQQHAKQLADLAVEAMLSEVVTWPKPGLVDPVEHKAHPDMDVFTFIKSSTSLRPYFYKSALVGLNFPLGQPWPKLFNQLRQLGQAAEVTMFAATNGVNTHKGTIFSLGILTGALGVLMKEGREINQENIQRIVQAMLVNLLTTDLNDLRKGQDLTAGEQQYLAYGQTGIRGEAASGFPTVFNFGLPALLNSNLTSQNDQQLDAFLCLARHTADSTLIKRAGDPAILDWKNQQLDQFFELGGLTTSTGRDFLKQLEQVFSKRHLSLGGAADLLIITIFLKLVMKAGNPNELNN